MESEQARQERLALRRGELDRLADGVTLYAVFVLDPILGADLRDVRMVEANAEEAREALERAGKLAAVIPMRRVK